MNLKMNRKLLYRIIAGAMLIAIAFVLYISKNIDDDYSLEISAPDKAEVDEAIEEESVETVPLISENTIVVDMAGEVRKPAVYILPEGSRVYQGIEAAGGLTEQADTRNTNLAAMLQDGIKLYIPSKKEVKAAEKESGLSAGSNYVGGSTSISASESKTEKINLNTANSEGLQKLPGVGPQTAAKIIEYRNSYGLFKKIEDLMNVSGIGEKTFEKLKAMITVE